MEEQRIQEYRRQLLAMRERLLEDSNQVSSELRELVSPPGELSSVDQHNADHDVEGLDTEVVLLQNERCLLSQIDLALERIENGTYGYCQNCNTEIAPARLAAIPYAAFCINCAQGREQRHEPPAAGCEGESTHL